MKMLEENEHELILLLKKMADKLEEQSHTIKHLREQNIWLRTQILGQKSAKNPD